MWQRELQLLLNAAKLWRTRRTQALLSMLGVTAGVCGVVLVIAVGQGAEREVESALGSLGAGAIIVRAEYPKTLDSSFMDASSALFKDALSEASGSALGIARVSADGQGLESVRLVGTDAEHIRLYPMQLHSGRFLVPHDLATQAQVCVVDWHLGQTLYPRGDVVGNNVRYGDSWCRVIGWLAENRLQSSALDSADVADTDAAIYLPASTLAGGRWSYPLHEVTLRFASEQTLGAVLPVLRRMVERHSGDVAAELLVPLELLRQKQRLQQLFQTLLLGIAFVLLLVGGTGIMNTMLLNVMSRRPEIGLRLAIGATRRDVVIQFVGESMVVALAGGIVGVLLGGLTAALASSVSPWEFIFSGRAAFAGLVAATLTGIVFGSYPALVATRVSPIKTLQTG